MTLTKKHLTPLAHMVALCEVLTDVKDINKADSLELVKNKIREFVIDNANNLDWGKWKDGVNNEKESIEGVIFARTQQINFIIKQPKMKNFEARKITIPK